MLKLNALVIRALKWRLWMQRNSRIFEDKSFSLEFSWDCFHLNTSWCCHSYSKLFCHIPISLILLDCKLFVSSSLGGGFAFFQWFDWFVNCFRGYNIGIRLIDEFLAKSNISRCVDFKETADVIAKVSCSLINTYANVFYSSQESSRSCWSSVLLGT